jgi:hypothetical protein
MCAVGSNEVAEGGYKVSDVCPKCLKVYSKRLRCLKGSQGG